MSANRKLSSMIRPCREAEVPLSQRDDSVLRIEKLRMLIPNALVYVGSMDEQDRLTFSAFTIGKLEAIDPRRVCIARHVLHSNVHAHVVFSNAAVRVIPYTERSRASRADRSPLLKQHSRLVASAALSVRFVSPK